MMRGAEKKALEREVWGNGSAGVAAEGFEAELGSGDGLFIPKGWWHSVKGIGEGMTGSVGGFMLLFANYLVTDAPCRSTGGSAE